MSRISSRIKQIKPEKKGKKIVLPVENRNLTTLMLFATICIILVFTFYWSKNQVSTSNVVIIDKKIMQYTTSEGEKTDKYIWEVSKEGNILGTSEYSIDEKNFGLHDVGEKVSIGVNQDTIVKIGK